MIWIIFPPNDPPRQVDVVMVIAGSDDGRHELALKIAREISADNFVVANPGGPKDKAGSRYCRGQKKPEEIKTWCLEPDPSTTAGEAIQFNLLAKEEGWNSAILVTNRPHSRRVNYIFHDCTDTLTLQVKNIEEVRLEAIPRQVVHELGGYIKHFFLNPCREALKE